MFDSGLQARKKTNGIDRIIPLEKYGWKSFNRLFVSPPMRCLESPMASGFLKQLITQETGYTRLPSCGSSSGNERYPSHTGTGSAGNRSNSSKHSQEVALAMPLKVFQCSEVINQFPVLGLVENMSWFTPAELPQKQVLYIWQGRLQNWHQNERPLLGRSSVQGIREAGDNGRPVALEIQSRRCIHVSAGTSLKKLKSEQEPQTNWKIKGTIS